MDERATMIRKMVQGLGRRRANEAIPLDVRDAVVEYAAARRPRTSWARLGDALGLSASTIQRWCTHDDADAGDSTALVPIVVTGAVAMSGGLVLVSPRGFRLEGLNLDDAGLLLDRLS